VYRKTFIELLQNVFVSWCLALIHQGIQRLFSLYWSLNSILDFSTRKFVVGQNNVLVREIKVQRLLDKKVLSANKRNHVRLVSNGSIVKSSFLFESKELASFSMVGCKEEDELPACAAMVNH
jgi:hypothetical protein